MTNAISEKVVLDSTGTPPSDARRSDHTFFNSLLASLRRFRPRLASAFELYHVSLASVVAAQRHAEHPCLNSCWRLEQGKKEHEPITTELAPMTM